MSEITWEILCYEGDRIAEVTTLNADSEEEALALAKSNAFHEYDRFEASVVLCCPRCGLSVEAVTYRRFVRTEQTYSIDVRLIDGRLHTRANWSQDENESDADNPEYEVLSTCCNANLTALLSRSCVMQDEWTPLPKLNADGEAVEEEDEDAGEAAGDSGV